jgi:hypothetical protein
MPIATIVQIHQSITRQERGALEKLAQVSWLARRRAGKGDPVNRMWRRMLRFGRRGAERQGRDEMANTESEVFAASTPQDVTSVRAKSSGHGKKTADKWNQ